MPTPSEYAFVLVLPAAGDRRRTAILLHGEGNGIAYDVEAGMALDEYGVCLAAPSEPGLWFWRGTPFWHHSVTGEGIDEGADPSYTGRGVWRRLTDSELGAFARWDLTAITGTRAAASDEADEADEPRSRGQAVPTTSFSDLLIDVLAPSPVVPLPWALDSLPREYTAAAPPGPVPGSVRDLPPMRPEVRVVSLQFVPVAQQDDEIITDERLIAQTKQTLDNIAASLERSVSRLSLIDPGYEAAMEVFQRALSETYLEGRRTVLVKRRVT